MKKWKLIVLTAVLSMSVGMQALAAEIPEAPGSPAETDKQGSDNTVEGAKDGTEQDAITTNLPVRDPNGDDWFILQNSAVSFSDGTEAAITSVQHSLWWDLTPSQRTISQEEAKKLIGAEEDCKIMAMDMTLFFRYSVPEEVNGKIITGARADEVALDWQGGLLRDIFVPVYDGDTTVSVKVLYSPKPGEAFTELPVRYVFSTTRYSEYDYIGLSGQSIPLTGATLVFVAGKPSSDTPTETPEESETDQPSPDTPNSSDSSGNSSTPDSSDSSSTSGSSGTPEAYSRGASVGEVGVKKSGAGVEAHVRKANGEEDSVVVHPYLAPGTKTLTQSQAQRMLGTTFACSIYSFDLSIVNAEGDYGPVTLLDGSVPVTFFVPGVTPESKVALRHWINGGDTYEDLPVEVGNGTVKATFTSFSPVVIVVEQPGVAAAANGPVSPKTGETSGIYMAEIVALLSLAGLFFYRKRRQA